MTNGPFALVFPGQGSQRVSMGADLSEHSGRAASIFALLDEISGRSIADFCWNGPEETLRSTDVAQPALVATEVALLCAMIHGMPNPDQDLPSALIEMGVRAVAGHSLGEYSACVAAGALEVRDALSLAVLRGQLMANAPAGTMIAVLGMDLDAVEDVCQASAGIVVVANDNAPGQVVLSGETSAIEAASFTLRERGAKRVLPLKVSGAFHSPLMAPAAAVFARALEKVDIRAPRIPLIGNVSALPLHSAGDVQEELRAQITSTVRWRASMLYLESMGVREIIEVGPGDVLAGLARRTVQNIPVLSIGTWAAIEALTARLSAIEATGPGDLGRQTRMTKITCAARPESRHEQSHCRRCTKPTQVDTRSAS